MTEFEKLRQSMDVLGAPPTPAPAPSRPDEYSGPDGVDGMTVITLDPTLEAAAANAPTAPPITAAQRGKVLPGTLAQVAAPAFEAPPAASGNLRLVFTGVSGAGKSTLVKQLGLQEIQIHDDIASLYQEFFPGQQPPADFVNTLLVWGEGVVDPRTPVTPARLLFVSFMRQNGRSSFGEKGFWTRSLVQRAQLAEGGAVVTTCTTQALLDSLKAEGFTHFHIAASQQTLAARKKRQGANDQLATALTNQIIREVSMRPQGAQLPVIWADTVPAPSPRFLTLETARQALQQSQQSVITGE